MQNKMNKYDNIRSWIY